MSRREQILDRISTIPAIPTAATRVIGLLQDPEVDINDVMEAIEYDPGLTSNVLRLANSAYFAGPRTIDSLRDAIVLLGMSRVFQLVITSAIIPIARQEVRGYDLPPGKLLEHCIAVAIACEELAGELNLKPPVSTFTAGLLHDVGKIVLSTFLEVDVAPIIEIAFRDGVSFEKAEAAVLGIDHAEVGAALLETWKLPSGIVEVVRYHHQPRPIEGDTLVVDLVHVADHLCIESGLGTGGVDGLNYAPCPESTARLAIKPTAVEAVVCRVITGMQALQDIV